jgi:general stress protein 26
MTKISFIIICFFICSFGWSQSEEYQKQKAEKIENGSLQLKIETAALEIMTSVKTCALITLDEEDRPRVRAMDPFLPEKDFTVWFGTNPNSRKVEQIKNNSKVTLYYLENESNGYVMIQGNAELVNNQEEKDKRWKPKWEAFYTNREDDYLLIKVTPEWMEVVSYTHNLVGDTISWEPPIVIFDKK